MTELLEEGHSITAHNRNIKFLVIELFKVNNGLSPHLINEIFVKNAQHYKLRKYTEFKRNNVTTVYYREATVFKESPYHSYLSVFYRLWFWVGLYTKAISIHLSLHDVKRCFENSSYLGEKR